MPNIGPYKVVKELGSGSFGRVFEVIDPNGKSAALKRFELSATAQDAVNRGLISEAELKKRFEREVRYQSEIDHINVMPILDYDTSATPPYFVMELAESTLEAEISKDRTLGGSPQQALFDILAGLEAIHDIGIFHRDLKPLNILRCKDTSGNVRYVISDFGLMTASSSATTSLTATGAQGGTPYYAAPELITSFKRATAAADVYSFGAILHDIFGGGAARVPYTELSAPGALDTIVRKCTKRLPARRYTSIAALRSDLASALSGPISFASTEEKEVVELLGLKAKLSEEEWDRVLGLLDGLSSSGKTNNPVMRALTIEHIGQLGASSPEIVAALGSDYCEWVRDREGAFDFNYCDVVSDRLQAFFDVGDVGLKANAILALLVLGASHNRWVVERRFARLAGPDLDDAVAKRIITDVSVLGFDFSRHMEHVEWSIKTSRNALHPLLQPLVK